MVERAQTILTQINLYSVSLIIIVCLFFLSFLSDRFKQGVLKPLQICILIWVVFFGYEVYTGKNIYQAITEPSQSQIEAAKYKKVSIDGRDVIYNKETGEIVKKPKK